MLLQKAQQMSISTIFKTNGIQFDRLPTELRFLESVKEVEVRALGNDLIISPFHHKWDEFFLKGALPLDDFMSNRDTQK